MEIGVVLSSLAHPSRYSYRCRGTMVDLSLRLRHQAFSYLWCNRGKSVGMAAFFACSGSTRCDSLRMCRSPRPFLG
jgi:hypothetical protein